MLAKRQISYKITIGTNVDTFKIEDLRLALLKMEIDFNEKYPHLRLHISDEIKEENITKPRESFPH